MRTTIKRMLSGLLCLAMLLCLVPVLENTANAATGYDRGYSGGMAGDGKIYAHGLDVSAWQESGLNFQNFANAGYDYVILRCGTSYGKDKCFEEYYASARAAGLDIGCYYYSYAKSVSEAQAEAYDMISWMSGKVFEYPIYFDYEDPSQSSISGSYASQICYGFMDILKANGYLVGMYSMASWLEQDWVTSSGIRNTYEGWVAHLTVNEDVYNTGITSSYYDDLLWKYGTRYGMHQYSFSTYVNGVGPFDCNVAFKDYPAIVKKFGFNGYSADTWRQDSTGWWYEYADGSYAVGWAKIDDKWYYFNANGYMYTGWLFDENYQAWYFMDHTSGAMRTGWVWSDGYYYYMDGAGKMLLGWQKIDGYWYYLNTTDQWPQGAMFTGWHVIDDKQYYFSETSDGTMGEMVTGWFHDGYHWYYFGWDGAMLYGWQNVDGAWYHFDETTGIMAAKAWVLKDDVWQYVNASGAMTEGATWTGTYEDALDIGTDFYATIDIPATGTRAGIDSDENSDTYRNLEVQAVRAEDAADFEEQLWYFQRREDGSYRITNVATEQCLDVNGGYVDAGTNVRVWTDNNAMAQRWFFYQDGDNYGMVSACNVWDKTVLDVADGLADEGTNIRIWPYNGSGAQRFKITPVDCHTEHDYTYEVTDAPTADADGTLTGTCSGCSEATTVTLPKLNTTDYTYTIEQAPTATASGIGRYTWNTDDYGTFYFDVELEPTGTIDFMLGDVDANGVIDTTDFMRVKAAYVGAYELSEIEFLAADVDRNGIVDTTDFMRIKAHFLGTYVIE